MQAPPAQFATKKRSRSRLLKDTLFQKVAFMFQRVQIISKCGQVRHLQRNQIDVGGHRTGDLLGCVSIFIDVAKDFIAVIFSVALEAHRRLQKASSLGLPGLR